MASARVSVIRKRWPGRLHTLSVLSSEAVRSRRPLLLNLTLRTVPLCALTTVLFPSTVGSQSLTVRSFEPDAMSPAVWL